MKKLLLLSTFFLGVSIYSQSSTCDGNRYKNVVFLSVDSVINVTYGNNTTMGGSNQDLKMNIYSPSGDIETKRPVIVFAHGGSFVSGTKEDMASLCRYFSSKGFVTATISYRLIDVFPSDSTDIIDEVVKATADMRAAIRFLKEDAATTNTYKIDTNYVFAGGISAGAIIANHVAYLDASDNIPPVYLTEINNNGGIEGNSSSNLQYSSKVHGVLNYSGGLAFTNWMNVNEAPLYSAHDDNDNVVPCQTGPTPGGFSVNVNINGSCAMAAYATNIGLSSTIYTVNNSTDHVSYFTNAGQTVQVTQESSDFLFNIICNQSIGIEESNDNNIMIYPNPTSGLINFKNLNQLTYNVIIQTLDGKIVKDQQINSSLNNIDLRDLTKGTYIIKISSDRTNVFVDKVLIQ